jgi:hypothetical protein
MKKTIPRQQSAPASRTLSILPSVKKMDSGISPATRLLQKRRLMYENQELFMKKKKEFQQAEIQFRQSEKVLRDKDS